MPAVMPLDEYTGEWYPGYRPEYFAAPHVIDPPRPFEKSDEGTFWFLDFHWPRGLTPLAATLWAADGYCWGTQHAAENLPIPRGRGISVRMAGTHLYGSEIPESDSGRVRDRFDRVGERLPRILRDYPRAWGLARDEIDTTWRTLDRVDLRSLGWEDLRQHVIATRGYHKRAMEIHFDFMYPLLVNYLAFRGACVEMGVDPDLVGRFFQGNDTGVMATDRELARLARSARQEGLSGIFVTQAPDRLRKVLVAKGGAAATWLSEFDDFLAVRGHRQDGTCDVALPSWIEDDTSPLGLVRSLLLNESDYDFERASRSAVAERDAAIDTARSGLTREEQFVFDQGLASNMQANFAWWQDDHNILIDMRVMLPLRRACLELADRVGADQRDDLIYLFWPELMELTVQRRLTKERRSLIRDRREYFEHWLTARPGMPKVLGTVPDSVRDPILLEIFGLTAESIRLVRDHDFLRHRVLHGVPAANGIAIGPARVLRSAQDLRFLMPGEIMVCESTSPNWTPAFCTIAGAVCDSGGTLSHAAIVGREYRVPTVTAVGIATQAIKDGDVLEIDGTAGSVRILRRSGDRPGLEATR